jgi:PTS system nitrogen regulatory IIA component
VEQTLSHLAQYLNPQDILLDIEVVDKGQLFDAIGRHVEKEHAIPRDLVISGLVRRERVGSTGLGAGIAIPHARIEGLLRIQIAYLRLKNPIPYDACDGQPVSDVMALLVPKRATDEHLLILADATQMLADHRFLERLHTCHCPVEVRSLFESNPSL